MPSSIKEDITGRKYSRLLVLRRAENSGRRRVMWECLCDCGRVKSIESYNLRHGKSRSCGCLVSELSASRSGRVHPCWRGGHGNQGSIAWCRVRIGNTIRSSIHFGYAPPSFTAEELRDAWIAAGGKCKICLREGGHKSLCVDHDHTTGKLRGIICGKCNSAIGLADESPSRLRSLAAYIESANGG